MIKYTFVIFVLLLVSNCFALTNDYLYPNMIGASSYLMENDFKVMNNYHPYYIIDDNPNTAWVEGVQGDGINEFVKIYNNFPKNEKVLIFIRNGYQKSDALFSKNNRIKELEVRLISGTVNNPKVSSQISVLKDEMGWQQINICPTEDSSAITLVIKSVYKGTTYEDTCISDIKINFETPLLEKKISQEELKNQYAKWFEERTIKATFFNNLPNNYPFKAYKKTILKKTIKDNSSLFNLEFYSKLFNHPKLTKLVSSTVGINYIKMLDIKRNSNESICTINTKSRIFLPDMFSEYIFSGIGDYIYLSNLNITAGNPRLTQGETIQKIKRVGNIIRTVDWRLILANKHEKTISRHYYDNQGKLFYIEGEISGEDGECSNDSLFVWDGGTITEIYWFFVQYSNNGDLEVQMILYE